MRDALEDGILSNIPNTERNGHADQRLTNTSNITFHAIESDALLLLLDQAGIFASSDSACLADSPDPSHVIAAMKPGASARQCVRFSAFAQPSGFLGCHFVAIDTSVKSLFRLLATQC